MEDSPQPLEGGLEPETTAGMSSRSGAILFFQLVNRRYEHASTVLTSNQGFERWGEILHDEVMAAALPDLSRIAGANWRDSHLQQGRPVAPR